MAYTTINKSTDYFNGATYLGSASAVTVSSLSFQPDLVWIKDRQNGNNHCLVDAVRGVGKYLGSNLTSAEVNSTSQSISSFTSTGFVTGTANPANEAASSSTGFMSWNWKANGAGSANTAGTISSTVSANTTAGFSIVSWTPPTASTPQTIGHGLGVAPSMMIVRNREYVGNWRVYHKSLGNTKALDLNGTGVATTDTGFWENTTPTSTVFTTGNGNGYTTGGSTDDYIAYCFAEVKGFSKFGSYVGNGSTDGTFVYTGFKPAFIMIKNTTVGDGWQLIDAKRNVTNGYNNSRLEANNANAESVNNTWTLVDLLSNGFKQRYTDNIMNASGSTYIYMAFAEQPLVGTNNIPATAR